MSEETLGRLEKVELRVYWQREDTHFTPPTDPRCAHPESTRPDWAKEV